MKRIEDMTASAGATADEARAVFPFLTVATAKVVKESVGRLERTADAAVDELDTWVADQAAAIARSDLGGDEAGWDVWDLVVKSLGQGRVALPRAYQSPRGGVASRDRLDQLVSAVAGGVDPTISLHWSPTARLCLADLSDIVDGEVPTCMPVHIDQVVSWLWWLWSSVPEKHKLQVENAARSVNTLGLVRHRWMQTCDDLIDMIAR